MSTISSPAPPLEELLLDEFPELELPELELVPLEEALPFDEEALPLEVLLPLEEPASEDFEPDEFI